MNINITQTQDLIVVTLAGELNTAAAIETEQALKPLQSDKEHDVLIDCSGLDYIASSGLRILLSLLKSVKANGHKLTLRGMNDDIKGVFKMTGLISLFDVE